MGYLSKFLGITAAVMFLSVSVVGAGRKGSNQALAFRRIRWRMQRH